MRSLLKPLLLVFILLITNAASAQLSFSGVAGSTFSNLKSYDKASGNYSKGNIRTGIHFGGNIQLELPDILRDIDESVNAKVLIEQKGAKVFLEDDETGQEMGFDRYTLTYLNIPVTARACYDLGDFNIYGSLGFYVSHAFKAKRKTKGNDELMAELEESGISDVQEYNISYSSVSDAFKPFDIGLVGGFGVEYSDFYLETEYEHGLYDIRAEYADNSNWNRSLRLTFGYKFDY